MARSEAYLSVQLVCYEAAGLNCVYFSQESRPVLVCVAVLLLLRCH